MFAVRGSLGNTKARRRLTLRKINGSQRRLFQTCNIFSCSMLLLFVTQAGPNMHSVEGEPGKGTLQDPNAGISMRARGSQISRVRRLGLRRKARFPAENRPGAGPEQRRAKFCHEAAGEVRNDRAPADIIFSANQNANLHFNQETVPLSSASIWAALRRRPALPDRTGA